MLHGPQVTTVATLVTVWTLATTALVLRLTARRMTKMSMWVDDFACLAAYTFGTAYNAWAVIWIHDGFGLRLEEITWLSRAEAMSRAKRDLYFLEAFNSLSIGASKLAILALYWRLFSLTRVRYAIMYLAFLSLCWLVARTTVGVIRCIPVVAYWDASVRGECFVDELKIIYGGSISHLILDTMILILPIFELRKLRLKFWPKVGVFAIFMFGILTCICAIGVIVSTLSMPSDDETSFNVRDTAMIAHVEVNFSIVTSCLPLLRPVFKSLHVQRHFFNWFSCSCAHRGASPPTPSSLANPEQQHQQHQQLQQQPPPQRRRHRFIHPMSLSTTLFNSTTWSHLSSAATGTGTANSGIGERTNQGRHKTAMTIVHDSSSRGVHVHLQRQFGFISPPEPELGLARPRTVNSLVEPETGMDAQANDENLMQDDDNVSHMDKEKGKATEGVYYPTQLDSKGVMNNRERAKTESEDESLGAGTASFVKGEDKAPKVELCADLQEGEVSRLDVSTPTMNRGGPG